LGIGVTLITNGEPFDDDTRDTLRRHGIDLVDDDAVAFIGERGDLEG
jgi:hypothetical protein